MCRSRSAIRKATTASTRAAAKVGTETRGPKAAERPVAIAGSETSQSTAAAPPMPIVTRGQSPVGGANAGSDGRDSDIAA